MINPFVQHSRGGNRRSAVSFACLTGLLAVLCLMMCGCDNSSKVVRSSDTDQLGDVAKGTKLRVSAATAFSPDDPLMPTGDATQDTENLQAALLDPIMNSGGTLYLAPGTFYVHSSLVRQSFDPGDIGYSPDLFNGTIQGAGKGVTIIRSVRGPGNASFGTFYDLPGTFMIWDFDYLGVMDLTFEADPEIADYWEHPALPTSTGLVSFMNIGSAFYGFGGQYGVDCINVHFKGSLDSGGNPEIPLMFEYFGGGDGPVNVKSCEFENGSFVMCDFGELGDAAINIGGSPKERVTFSNETDWSVQSTSFWGVGDCSINLSFIDAYNATGLSLWAHELNSASNVSLTNSNIDMIPDSWFAGAEVWVMPGRGDVTTVVSNNRIHSEDAFLFGPIMFEGVHDAVIANNKITGRGSAAMYLGVIEQWPGSATIMGNNLQGWENTGVNDWGLFAAPIWLGSYVTNSTVVGGNNKINVFDEPGYDWDWNPLPPDAYGNAQTYEDKSVRENIVPKNNTFTGVNNTGTNVGHDMRDAMHQKVEAKKAMMTNRRR